MRFRGDAILCTQYRRIVVLSHAKRLSSIVSITMDA